MPCATDDRADVFSGLLSFLAMTAVLAVVLAVLNWLPGQIDGGLLREFRDIEDVRRELGMRDIHSPAYFPEDISWPPTRILARTRPHPAVVLEFASSEGWPYLVIVETFGGSNKGLLKAGMREVAESASYPLKGRPAVLRAGLCGEGRQCSEIEWIDGDRSIHVQLQSTPFELIRIAESMIR